MTSPRLLADRYRFHRRLSGKAVRAVVWLALDEQTDRNVVAALLPASRVATLRNALRLRHERLAAIVDIVHAFTPAEIPESMVPADESLVVVAEWIPGRTLHEQLSGASMTPFEVVQTLAKVCTGVAALHDRSAAHGALSSRVVLVRRVDGGSIPLITQAVVPPDAACFSPERVNGGGPSSADDTWAMHVILFEALTGARPFDGDSRQGLANSIASCAPPPLTSFGVVDEDLGQILDRGFAKSADKRCVKVEDLLAELALWLTRNGPRARGELESTSRAPLKVDFAQADTSDPDARESTRTPGLASALQAASVWGQPVPEPRRVFTGYYASHAPHSRTLPTESQDDPEIAYQVIDPSRSQRPPRASNGERNQSVRPKPEATDASAAHTTTSQTGGSPSNAALQHTSVGEVIRGSRVIDAGASMETDRSIEAAVAALAPAVLQASRANTGPGSIDAVSSTDSTTPIQAAPSIEEAISILGARALNDVKAIEAPKPVEPLARSEVSSGTQLPRDGAADPTPESPSTDDPGSQVVDELSHSASVDARGDASLPPTTSPTLPQELQSETSISRPSASVAAYQRKSTKVRGWVAVLGIAAIALVALLVRTRSLDSGPEGSASSTAASAATLSVAASTPTATPPPLPSAQASAPSPAVSAPVADIDACVASYFPPDTFHEPQDLGFVCEEKEVRRGAARMRVAIVRGSRAALTAGMDEWGKLNWYELALYGIVRRGCCHADPAVEAPDSPPPCESLAVSIDALAKAVESKSDVDLRVLGFEKAVLCVFNSYDIPKPYSYGFGPYAGSQNVFARVLKRLSERR